MNKIQLDTHDQELDIARVKIAEAFDTAHQPAAVAKHITATALRYRNTGRSSAKPPFQGKCEASGRPLSWNDAVRGELEPDKGDRGRVRWVCHKANNSGKQSCGGC